MGLLYVRILYKECLIKKLVNPTSDPLKTGNNIYAWTVHTFSLSSRAQLTVRLISHSWNNYRASVSCAVSVVYF